MEAADPIGGRYRLRRVVGAGQVGRVWLADDELLGRAVAIEEISTAAEAIARLGVPHVFDVIRRAGTSWIVTEYPPPPRRAIGVFPVRPMPAGRRLARSTRVTLIIAAVLLVGTTGAALALDSTGSAPVRPAPVAAVPACADQTAAGSVLITDQGEQRYALPSGWIWHHDPSGMRLALPQGWTWRSSGAAACFRDPRSGRSLLVSTDGPVLDDPVEYWVRAEQDALAGGDLPGYRRIGMAPLDLRDGGADWEFTWQPGPGVRRHERRLLLSMGPDRAYVLDWSAGETDWATSEPILSLIVASIS